MSSKVTELESIRAKTRTGPPMTGSMSFPHPFLAQREESGINNSENSDNSTSDSSSNSSCY